MVGLEVELEGQLHLCLPQVTWVRLEGTARILVLGTRKDFEHFRQSEAEFPSTLMM